MNLFEDGRLVLVDDEYDSDYASDRSSRYGAYLRQRRALFTDDGDELGAVAFAVRAWQIASGPIMSPGYVRVRPDIEAVRCWHADEPGFLLADVEVRLRPPGLLAGPADGWSTWARGRDAFGDATVLLDPDDTRRSLLLTANVRVPISAGELPEPTLTRLGGGVDVHEAKTAIAVLCRQINEIAGPVVAYLRELHLGVRR